jgi:hypothetical protein
VQCTCAHGRVLLGSYQVIGQCDNISEVHCTWVIWRRTTEQSFRVCNLFYKLQTQLSTGEVAMPTHYSGASPPHNSMSIDELDGNR